MTHSSLDRAVDQAHEALTRLGRLAAQHEALDLERWVREARSEMLDIWERSE